MNFKTITKLMFAVCAMLQVYSAFSAASSSSAAATFVRPPEPAINVACRNGRLGTVRILLAHNARPTPEAQQIAKRNGHIDIVTLLQDHKFTCRACKKKDKNVLSKCAKCKIAPYCSEDCQRKDWPTHKKHCKPITTTRKAITLTPMQKKLVNAAVNGNFSQLKKLINKDNINYCHPALGPILTLAVASQNYKAVKLLLKQRHIKIDQRNPKDKSTALFNACQLGHTSVVKLLLENGADPDIQIYDGATPLFIACQEGHDAIVQILLNHESSKAYLNKPMKDESTPLYAAARHNKPKIVEQLLIASADTTATAANSQTALFVAAGLGYSDIINTILEHDLSSIDQPNSEGATPLMLACQMGQQEAVECLLSKGANIKITKPNGATALHVCCIKNHSEIIKLLLDNDADPCAVDEHGKTPLIYVCTHGSVESTQLLLEDPRVDPNYRIQSGKLAANSWVTPLIAACSTKHKEVVELLLSHKSVDPNMPIVSTGKTPLIIAIETENKAMVELLLQNGADPTQTDNLGPPLEYAQTLKERAVTTDKRSVFDDIITLLNRHIPIYEEKNTCIECKKTFKKRLKKCSACRKARYCSRECQIADWPNHSKSCKKQPEQKPAAPEDEIDDTPQSQIRPEDEIDDGIIYNDYAE